MGLMTNQGSIPSLPRLSRPSLPTKVMLVAEVPSANEHRENAARIGEYVTLPPQSRDSIAKCADSATATLVSEEPSDDERKPVSNSFVPSSTDEKEQSNSKSKAKYATKTTTMTNTGVYFEDVEIRNDIHPLQSCCIENGSSPLQARRMMSSRQGRPLTAAPLLPGRAHIASLEPLRYTSLQSKRPVLSTAMQTSQPKRQRCDGSLESVSSVIAETRQDEAVVRKSRSAQVKEASFMIEAAFALANLQHSLESS